MSLTYGGSRLGHGGVLLAPSSGAVTPEPEPSTSFISGLSVNGVDGVDKATLPTSSPFYTWRGGTKPIDSVSTWADNGAATTENVWALTVDGYGPFPGILDLAIGGFYPAEGDTWEGAASGALDARIRTCIQVIADYRRGKGNAGTYVQAVAAGFYLVSVTCWLKGGGTGERNIGIKVNGTMTREFGAVAAGRVSFSDVLLLAANSTVTLSIYTTVSSVVVGGGSTKDTGLGLTYLGAAA